MELVIVSLRPTNSDITALSVRDRGLSQFNRADDVRVLCQPATERVTPWTSVGRIIGRIRSESGDAHSESPE
jgi:hypothetical protein